MEIILLIASLAIVDGDTVRGGGQSFRLWGLDCPERGRPGGDAATRGLAALLAAQPPGAVLRCRAMGTSWRRIVVRCTLPGGRDLAAAMIRSGRCREWCAYSGGVYGTCRR